ncbi:tubulin-tyrosine ligase [Neolentinus lepideus HHB14362 ss-1]|uniref:Tubulin-tyrosine ligase n=1 Tax=Neolentinus lepideus HHB14362 ss-1 TaxID=1314782 RepID=A0A165VXY2_9AGAM|nr:tubulin-tyrosine ligase [Neolentinus lepideus HHB14362 ss-1]
MDPQPSVAAVIEWPEAPVTLGLVSHTLTYLSVATESRLSGTLSNDASASWGRILQWQSYDHMNHDLTLAHPSKVLSSSYTIRKALIRKHYLSRCVSAYLTKHSGDSPLKSGTPRTWEVEISWSDEIDDKWTDELWDLGMVLDENREREPEDRRWFILKPGMADRGNGIRIFDSKDALQNIFEEWDENDDDEDEADDDQEDDSGTGIVTSQLRHFVVQQYISTPLLLDPTERPIFPFLDTKCASITLPHLRLIHITREFHLRAYVLARGALRVYLYTNILALFSSAPYGPPSSTADQEGNVDLTPHLTNTCLQPDHSEEHVRTLDELVGCTVLGASEEETLSKEDVESIKARMGDIVAEVFKAALENPVHFQPLPNAFELFGVDFLLSHPPPSASPSSSCPYTVSLLELNAEPAIEMTGKRLYWLLHGLFTGIGEVAVRPWLEGHEAEEDRKKWCMRKVLDVQVRGGW